MPDEYWTNKKDMENRVISILAGNAATEIVFGEADMGANDDLHRAFDIVKRFVDDYCSYGFGYWVDRDNSQTLIAKGKKMKMNNYVVIDIETSGLDEENDEIIRLSALKIKNVKIVDRCFSLCNRHQRSVEVLEQMVREGKFGNIYHVYCYFRDFRCIPGLGGDFTTKAQSGGGVLIDWGVHFFDLVLYILGGAKLKSVSCNAYSEMAKDMKSYKYVNMWAEDTKNVEHGTNDVDDYITGYIRTDKASSSFNGNFHAAYKLIRTYRDYSDRFRFNRHGIVTRRKVG